jgi:hypothetical protein
VGQRPQQAEQFVGDQRWPRRQPEQIQDVAGPQELVQGPAVVSGQQRDELVVLGAPADLLDELPGRSADLVSAGEGLVQGSPGYILVPDAPS